MLCKFPIFPASEWEVGDSAMSPGDSVALRGMSPISAPVLTNPPSPETAQTQGHMTRRPEQVSSP